MTSYNQQLGRHQEELHRIIPLVLFPSSIEAHLCLDMNLNSNPVQLELGKKRAWAAVTGFGPSGSAAQCSRLLAQLPDVNTVILAGVAGSLNCNGHLLGSACWASEVRMDGIGVSQGGSFHPLPYPELPDELPVNVLITTIPDQEGKQLGSFLSVCGVCGNEDEHFIRAHLHPNAIGEEMEGHGVGLACRLWGKHFMMVRGFAHKAGDRDRKHWKMEACLDAVKEELKRWGDG